MFNLMRFLAEHPLLNRASRFSKYFPLRRPDSAEREEMGQDTDNRGKV